MSAVIEALGIMGGTFDPIHYGHLVSAEAARHAFSLDKVVFVPTGRPPHKEHESITDAEHRYLMTVLATMGNPFFETSRIEIDRPGRSYTIDTIEEFRRRYPSAQIFFITGVDAILEILTWRNPDELLRKCRFIAATRPGYRLVQLETVLAPLGERAAERVEPLEVPALAISSSDIRRRVTEGRPIRYLLPDGVRSYIYKNSLYQVEAGTRTRQDSS